MKEEGILKDERQGRSCDDFSIAVWRLGDKHPGGLCVDVLILF